MPRHRAAPDAPVRPVLHGRRAARHPVRRARTLLVTAIA
ncbi:peptidase, partial [Clavibacter michiganensis]